MAKKQHADAETPEPELPVVVPATAENPDVPFGLTPQEQGFTSGPKESGPAERVLPDVIGTVTMPAEVPNMIDSSGVDTVVIAGKRYFRSDVEDALADAGD